MLDQVGAHGWFVKILLRQRSSTKGADCVLMVEIHYQNSSPKPYVCLDFIDLGDSSNQQLRPTAQQ